MTATAAVAPVIRFTAASRPMRRFSNTQTIVNLTSSNSFQPIPLPATGYVRKVACLFTAAATAASTGALVAGDTPFTLITSISLSDATGQPIYQPVTGFMLYLINKYLPTGTNKWMTTSAELDPTAGPEYTVTGTATAFAASFRLDMDFEIDSETGYGCVPNLDANASLLVQINVAPITAAYTGTTLSAATVSVTIDQHYWAPTASSISGVSAAQGPDGAGDFLLTAVQTKTVSASTENIVNMLNQGGLVRGIIAVSRASGARVAYTAGTNVGLVYDNVAIDEGIKLEAFNDNIRRSKGLIGTDRTTSYPALSAGTAAGLDAGVLVWDFAMGSPSRDTWLNTKTGTQLQMKVTPGTSAVDMQLITVIAQVNPANAAAFYRA